MNVVRGYGREASADAPVVILFVSIWFGYTFLSGSDIFFYLAWIYFLSGLDIFSIRLGYIFYLARIFLEALSLRSVCGMSFV